MNTTLLENQCKKSIYKRKEGTSSSYYWQSGSRILPNRMSISKERELSHVSRNGRNLLHSIMGQMKGSFTQKEDSPLKQNKPFSIHTQLWQIPEYPLNPYGTIGISNTNGKITRQSDFGDVVIIHPLDYHWELLEIYYFPAMLDKLEIVMQYIQKRLQTA